MRVLALHIFNPSEPYNRMLELQRRMDMSRFPNVTRYFVQYRENPAQQDVVVDGDMVYVQGRETDVLGITEKTIRAIRHLLSLDWYHFVVRSNISTVIFWERLLLKLRALPRRNLYTGAPLRTYAHDKKLRYAQGTMIVWSVDVANTVVEQEARIDRAIVDDVTLAYFAREHLPAVYHRLETLPGLPWKHIHPGQSPAAHILPQLTNEVMVRLRVDMKDTSRERDIRHMEELVAYANRM